MRKNIILTILILTLLISIPVYASTYTFGKNQNVTVTLKANYTCPHNWVDTGIRSVTYKQAWYCSGCGDTSYDVVQVPIPSGQYIYYCDKCDKIKYTGSSDSLYSAASAQVSRPGNISHAPDCTTGQSGVCDDGDDLYIVYNNKTYFIW